MQSKMLFLKEVLWSLWACWIIDRWLLKEKLIDSSMWDQAIDKSSMKHLNGDKVGTRGEIQDVQG